MERAEGVRVVVQTGWCAGSMVVEKDVTVDEDVAIGRLGAKAVANGMCWRVVLVGSGTWGSGSVTVYVDIARGRLGAKAVATVSKVVLVGSGTWGSGSVTVYVDIAIGRLGAKAVDVDMDVAIGPLGAKTVAKGMRWRALGLQDTGPTGPTGTRVGCPLM